MLSWIVEPHDLATRVIASKKSLSRAGVAFCNKSNSQILKKTKKKEARDGKLGNQDVVSNKKKWTRANKKEVPHQDCQVQSNNSLCHRKSHLQGSLPYLWEL